MARILHILKFIRKYIYIYVLILFLVFCFLYFAVCILLHYIELEGPARFASSFITDNMLIYNLTISNVNIIVLEVVGEYR